MRGCAVAVRVTMGGRTYVWREEDHPRGPGGEFAGTGGGRAVMLPRTPEPSTDRQGAQHRAAVSVQAASGGEPAPTYNQRARQLDRMSEAELRPLAERHRPHIVEDYDGEPSRRLLTSTILNGERQAGLIRADTPSTPASRRAAEVSVTDAREASQAELDYTNAMTAVTSRSLDIANMPRAEVVDLYRQATGQEPAGSYSKQWMASAITAYETRQGLLPNTAQYVDRVPERRRRTLANQIDREERARRRAR